MSTVFICGFECGAVGSTGNDDHWNLATTGELSTSIVRSGDRSYRIHPSAQSGNGAQAIASQTGLGPSDLWVGRLYVRFETLPDADCYIAWSVGATPGNNPPFNYIGIGFHQSSGQFRCAQGINPTFDASAGVAATTGVWYRIDVKLDHRTAEAEVVNASVNGASLNPMTFTTGSGGDGNSFFRFGTLRSGNITADAYFDDVALSVTEGDYPLGDGYALALVPTSDGSHNIAGANQWERGNPDSGVDITNATTDAHELVDEIPMDNGTPTSADWISAVAPANSTDYVELAFITTPLSQAPTSVEVLVGTHQQGTGVGNTRIALNDNGSLDNIINHTRAGVTTIRFDRKHYTDPPSAASAWTITPGDGDFTNLRVRMYSSDANPAQHWDGIVIEADFAAESEPPPPGGAYECAGTLPCFTIPDQDKIDELRALRAAGTGLEVFELAKINWPDDEKYYSVLQTDEVASVPPPVTPIETRLIPDSSPDWFLPVSLDATIGDEEVDLAFWDGDGEFSDLLVEHGEGIKVELFYWFPQVELLLPIWQGHLRQEDDAEIDICKVKAVQGFRSADGLLPRRAHYKECQAIFGAVFDTQEEIDQHDCPYNDHIGGDIGVPGFTSCPRRTRQDCIDRLGNSGNFMLSHATASISIANNQSSGPNLYSTTKGNETNLKEPVPVVMGTRRIHGMPVLNFRKDYNNNNPDHGFYAAIYEACEGPLQSITGARITVGGSTQDAVAMHYNARLGEQGQTPVSNMGPHSYSSTALILYVFGWVNPADIDPGDASASVIAGGINNLRVYTDETTYTEEWSSNRAWHIMRMLTDKRWGYGYDYDRLDIQSFIEAACWCANQVRFTDANGDTYDHIRARSDIELRGRKVQQQIEDICMTGRLTVPFLFNGKIHIVPLREMTSAELAAAPVFTDEGSGRNIIQDEIEPGVFKTSLRRSRISDLDLPNRIETTYDPAIDDWLETPARPIEDIDAQLAAGRVVGDFSRKINVKSYGLAGVTVEGHALKVATSLLDLGPFDEGGLQNNLRLKCRIWYLDSLDLYPSRVVKFESSQITRYGFDYFRVMKMKRLSDLEVELEVQAYNPEYMATFETLLGGIDPLPDAPADPEGPAPDDPPFPLTFGDVSFSGGVLYVPISVSG